MTATRRRRGTLAGALILLVLAFVALGLWQMQRRTWKHALIARVESRVHAPPAAAPATSSAQDAYRRIRATGHFLPRNTLVRAVSDLGAGYWVMTPLDTGRVVLLVNRGFIAQEARDRVGPPPSGPATVTGLLRISEPDGGFLRANDPTGERWYSRDVAAMSRALGLSRVAPYFIDADDRDNGPGKPVGGLTVVRFADNHLVYALTWFGMAGLSAWAARYVLRRR